MSSLWRRFFLGCVTGVGATGLKVVVNFALVPVIMATLGTEAFSYYVLLAGLIELCPMLDFGFSSALTKELGADLESGETSEQNQRYLKIGRLFYGFLAFIVMVVGYLIAEPVLWDLFHLGNLTLSYPKDTYLLAVLTAGIYCYANYFRAVNLARCNHMWNHIGDAVNQIGGNIAGLALLLLGHGLPAFFAARAVFAVVMMLILRITAKQHEKNLFRQPVSIRKQDVKTLTSISAHGTLIQLSVLIAHKLDSIVIAANLPLVSLGMMDIVVRFLSFAGQMLTQVAQGFFPMFSNMASKGETAKARIFYLESTHFLVLLQCLLILLVVAFWDRLVFIFSSNQFTLEETFPYLLLFIPISISGVIQLPAAYYLFASGHVRFLTVSSLIAAGANLVISLILVKIIGLAGVVLGTLIPQLIQHNAFLVRKSCKELQLPGWQFFKLGIVRVIPTVLVGAALLAGLRYSAWPTIQANGQVVELGAMALAALVVLPLAMLTWYGLSATTEEKQYLHDNLNHRLPSPLRRWVLPAAAYPVKVSIPDEGVAS